MDPNKYHTVTITSYLRKLFENILLNRIQKHLQISTVIVSHPLQFGFVKEHEAIPAFCTLTEAIQYNAKWSSSVYL